MNCKKTIYFLCTPSLGIADNWLPAINRLKEKKHNFKFSIIIPKSNSINQFDPSDTIVKILNELFDSIIFKTKYGNWIEVESFELLRSLDKRVSNINYINRVFNKLRKFPFVSIIEKKLINIKQQKERKQLSDNLISQFNFDLNNSALLFDVQETKKNYNLELIKAFKGCIKFSINHGININTDPILKRILDKRNQNELSVYMFSNSEKEFYKESFGLNDNELVDTGIARHNKKWIDFVCSYSHLETDWTDFVFLISRPASPYLPRERKIQYLKDIKKYLIDQKGLKVIVKRHPKENDEGLFELVFGQENKGISWDISTAHPFKLGKLCKFAISFYSGVPMDMIYIGKPVIEYLNLDKINQYDNQFSNRDKNGHVVFSYRYLELVLGASTTEQFQEHVDAIITDPDKELQKLRTKYNYYFTKSFSPIDFITNDILSKLT